MQRFDQLVLLDLDRFIVDFFGSGVTTSDVPDRDGVIIGSSNVELLSVVVGCS